MAYINTEKHSNLNVKQDDLLASKRFVLENKPETSYFYELEEAVVLDVVMDETHPLVKNNSVKVGSMPPNIDGSEVEPGSEDYGRIGCIKFRFLHSEKNKNKPELNWAYPIESTGVTEWPLMNEIVIVGSYIGEEKPKKFYYTRKINFNSIINSPASFITEPAHGLKGPNKNEYTNAPYEGPTSKLNYSGGANYTGILGSYFKFNPKIRNLKRYEGDTILQSRFGSTIRFGAYDDTRENDNGLNDYTDGGGNPMILIRNRQAPVELKQGFNPKGYTVEDINKDGSSIHITSGKTISKFATTCKKVIWQMDVKEEQPAFSPDGNTNFNFPKLDGDQIVINSDRLVFSSKANETFHFSKKRLAMVTDDEFTIDADGQIVITTNSTTTINSPFIFLGEWEQGAEPVLLGRTTTAWDMALCDWILLQTNWMIELCEEWLAKHIHDLDSMGNVQTPPRKDWGEKLKKHISDLKYLREKLIELRDRAPKNMSKRVFTVGGGGAPGYSGGKLAPDTPSEKNKPSEEKNMAEPAEPPPEDPTKKKYTINLIYSGGGSKSAIDK